MGRCLLALALGLAVGLLFHLGSLASGCIAGLAALAVMLVLKVVSLKELHFIIRYAFKELKVAKAAALLSGRVKLIKVDGSVLGV